MKKTVMSTLLLSTLVFGGAQAFAAEAPTTPTNIQTEGTITFEEEEDGGTEEPEIENPNYPEEETKPGGEIPGDKPGGQTNPNKAKLQLQYAPNFNFGTQKVSVKEETYNAMPGSYTDEKNVEVFKPLFAQVKDTRLPGKGETVTPWTLSLAADDFSDGLAKGSSIKLTNIQLINTTAGTEGEVQTVPEITVVLGQEAQDLTTTGKRGQTLVRFGDSNTFSTAEEAKAYDNVQLIVPGKVSQSSAKDVAYKTNLTWNLKAGDAATFAQGTPTV